MKAFTDLMKEIAENANKPRQYLFHSELEEVAANVTGDLAKSTKSSGPGSFDTVSGPDGEKRKKRRELDLYNGKVFTVSKEQFEKMRTGKVRGLRWNRYIDEDSGIGLEIKQYSLRNPSKPVVIKNGQTGETIFLRRKWTDQRLRHNRTESTGSTNKGWSAPPLGWTW